MLIQKKALLFCFIFFSSFLYCNESFNTIIKVDFKSYIQQYLQYEDSRPYHYEKTKEVNNILLESFSKRYLTDDISEEDLVKSLKLFYRNSKNSFEDSVDYYYSTKNRALSLLSVSLLSEAEFRDAFIYDAINLLKKDELFYDQEIISYLFLLIYEIDNNSVKGVTRVHNELSDKIFNIDDDLFREASDLIFNKISDHYFKSHERGMK